MITDPENSDEQPYEFDEPIITSSEAEAERICRQKAQEQGIKFKRIKIRIGARPGQVVLLVDLSVVEQPSAVLKHLTSWGYEPQLRYLELKTGLHIVAVLKNEQHDPTQPLEEEYLLNEWEALSQQIHSDAVRLWRGHPMKSKTTG